MHSRAKKTLLIIYAAIIPLAFLSCYLWLNYEALAHSCEKGADHELMGVAIELAKQGQALTGPYSRFGFRHPGPLMPYLYAFFEFALPGASTPMGKHLIGQALLNTGFMILVGWWCTQFVRPRWLALLSFSLCAMVMWGPGRPFFHDYWNPSVTMAPMLGALLSAAAVARGRLGWIVPLTFSGAILCSSHLACIPIYGALVVGALGLFLKRGNIGMQIRRNLLPLSAALIILFGAVLPVLIEAAATAQYGNIGAIYRFQSAATGTKPLGAALEFVGSYFTGGIFSLLSLSPVLTLLLTIMSLLILAYLSQGFMRDLAFLCALVTIVAVFSATRVSGNFEAHLLRCMLGTAAASQLVFAAFVTKKLRVFASHLPRASRLQLAPFFVLAAWIFYAGIPLSKQFTPRYEQCGRIAQPFMDALSPQHGDFYRLAIEDQDAWPFAAPLGLSLLRAGADICVDEKWRYLFDSALTCAWQENLQGRAPRTLRLYRNPPADLPTTEHVFKGPLNWMLW